MKRIKFNRNWLPLVLSFLLPLLIMGSYFAVRQMFPFGKSSILTVDLGQQYIDFFAYFRDTLLHHPQQFLYSFSKTIGGDMLSVWAYYLMSPFNLLLLLTPGKWLTAGVLGITLLKYACSGLSMGWLLHKTQVQKGLWIPTFATAYALMGWMIANQLNVIWLDAPILLPLICLGLEKLFQQKRPLYYTLSLGLMLIINYYMGYMICLFIACYFIWASVRYWTTFKAWCAQLGRFIWGSLSAALLAAMILLPTFYALTQSKATYTVTKFKWHWEYAPLKMLSKFVVGAFNFDQMPTGFPNLFVGSLVGLGFILYFLQRRIPWQVRLTAALITIFLLSSMCLQPLDLLWHAGQFPIWYPYRFSFVVCFWFVWLAAISLQKGWQLQPWHICVLAVILLGFVGYIYFHLANFNFLKPNQLLLTIIFSFLTLIMLILWHARPLPWFGLIFLFLVSIEATSNAYLSLNQISYVSQHDYAVYTARLKQTVNQVKRNETDSDFYRLEKTFMRTKNDAMEANYNSASHFSSTFEADLPTFMGRLGQPAGDGFVTYSNGTLLSDAFFNMKYYLAAKDQVKHGHHTAAAVLPALTTKPDLTFYRTIGATKVAKIYQNPFVLPLGFAAANTILKPNQATYGPLQYQSQLFNQLLGKQHTISYFQPILFDRAVYHNLKREKSPANETYEKINKKKVATLTYYFTPKTSDPYYLTLGANLNSKAISLNLNGHPITQYDTFRDTVVVDLAAAAENQPLKLTITFRQNKVWLQNFQLYHFNLTAFNQGTQILQNQPWHVRQTAANRLAGNITVKKQQVLMTTIPYAKGWHVTVDGKATQPKRVLKALMAIPLKAGTHHVVLHYWPPYLTLGLGLSIGSLCVTLGLDWYCFRRQHH